MPLHANVFAEASICRLVSRFPKSFRNRESLWLTKLLSTRLELFISIKLVLKMSSNFFQKQTNDSCRFISELTDVFYMAGVHQQPDQSNYLAEGKTCKLGDTGAFHFDNIRAEDVNCFSLDADVHITSFYF